MAAQALREDRQAGREGGNGWWRRSGGAARRRGFTLVELLVVLAVAGLVLGWAVPALQDVFLRARTTATVNDLMGLAEAGRAIAGAGHVPVTLCPVAGEACARRWDGEVMLFRDVDGDGSADPEDEVLQRAGMLAPPLWVVWKPFRSTPYLTWTPRGQASSMNGTFTLCNDGARSDLLRQVVVSRAGRVRVTRPATASAMRDARRACGW